MNPEREILNLWLNKNGFFTTDSIPLANNKIIDVLAIKSDLGKIDKIIHIETACSISTLDNIPIKVYSDKFNDKNVVKKVKSTIKNMLGTEQEYEKILIIGNTSRPQDFEKLEGIKIVKFEDILLDVMQDMNKQNYRNEVVRTLQLVKYLMLSKSDKVSEMINSSSSNKIFTHQDKEDFIKTILEQDEFKQILGKESLEDALLNVLSGSGLLRPEKLAHALESDLFSTRSKKKFERLIIAKQKPKTVKEKPEVKPKEKSLSLFFEN